MVEPKTPISTQRTTTVSLNPTSLELGLDYHQIDQSYSIDDHIIVVIQYNTGDDYIVIAIQSNTRKRERERDGEDIPESCI